jgi:hypothetical protein
MAAFAMNGWQLASGSRSRRPPTPVGTGRNSAASSSLRGASMKATGPAESRARMSVSPQRVLTEDQHAVPYALPGGSFRTS